MLFSFPECAASGRKPTMGKRNRVTFFSTLSAFLCSFPPCQPTSGFCPLQSGARQKVRLKLCCWGRSRNDCTRQVPALPGGIGALCIWSVFTTVSFLRGTLLLFPWWSLSSFRTTIRLKRSVSLLRQVGNSLLTPSSIQLGTSTPSREISLPVAGSPSR